MVQKLPFWEWIVRYVYVSAEENSKVRNPRKMTFLGEPLRITLGGALTAIGRTSSGFGEDCGIKQTDLFR